MAFTLHEYKQGIEQVVVTGGRDTVLHTPYIDSIYKHQARNYLDTEEDGNKSNHQETQPISISLLRLQGVKMASGYDMIYGHPLDNKCFILRPLESPDSNPYILYLSFTGRLKGGITSPQFIRTTTSVKHRLLATKSMSISDFNQTLKTVLLDVCNGRVPVKDRNKVAIGRLREFDPDAKQPARSSSLPTQREMCEVYVLTKTVWAIDGIPRRQRHCVVM